MASNWKMLALIENNLKRRWWNAVWKLWVLIQRNPLKKAMALIENRIWIGCYMIRNYYSFYGCNYFNVAIFDLKKSCSTSLMRYWLKCDHLFRRELNSTFTDSFLFYFFFFVKTCKMLVTHEISLKISCNISDSKRIFSIFL